MKLGLGYYRVSTDEQSQEGISLETQKRLCHKWATENNFTIVDEYADEGKSATSLNRPAIKELLSRCQQDRAIEAVLVQDTDRLARNTLDHLTIKSILQKCGVALISISQPMIDSSPEGNLIDTIIASVNAFQSQITGRKTSKVLEQKAQIGWWPGGKPPLGYRNIDNPKPISSLDRKIIAVDPETAPYMKRAFELYSAGQTSVQVIADRLYQEGLRPKKGGILQDSVLINYLRNPFYIGQMRWCGQIYQGEHPPLISEELFYQCQTVLTAHNHNASRTRKHNFLLRGYVFCHDCGRRLWGEHHTKKSGLVFRYYFCINCRRNSYIDCTTLEKAVGKEFEKIEISREYTDRILETARQVLQEMREGEKSERMLLYHRKSRLEAAMRDTEDSRFVKHTLPEDGFKRIYGRYEEELKSINSQIDQLENDHSKAIEILERVYGLAENIGKSYQEAAPHLKRQYLALFWEGFDVKGGKIMRVRLNKELKPLLSRSMVRVRNNGLPLIDTFRNEYTIYKDFEFNQLNYLLAY